MTRISVFRDDFTDSTCLDKGLLEIENTTNGIVETSIVKFDLLEYCENGLELRLLFKGDSRVITPEIISPIISITSLSLDESSEEITLRLGRDSMKKVKVVIESDSEAILKEIEVSSKESYLLLKKQEYFNENAVNYSLDSEEDKEYSFDIPLGEEVFSFRKEDIEDIKDIKKKNNEEPVSIEGRIFYVKASNSRFPRNVCLNGIRIKLYNEDNKLVSTRITRRRGRDNGHFKFSGLEKGEYKVKFLIPCNLEIVKETCDDIKDNAAYISFKNEGAKYIKIGVIKKGE